MFDQMPPLETKDGEDSGADNIEIKNLVSKLTEAVEALHKENDERITLVEKGLEDVVKDEKVDHINTEISELKDKLDSFATTVNRSPQGEMTAKEQKEELEHKKSVAFYGWMQSGVVADSEYMTPITDQERNVIVQKMVDEGVLDTKTLAVGSGPDGGFVAPPEVDMAITSRIREVSPVRQIATVRQIGGTAFIRNHNILGTASGWVGESGSRPSTANSQLVQMEFPAHEIYAMPAASQNILDDAMINMEQWIADEVMDEFALQEGIAFITGDGVAKPRGFTTYPANGQADENRAWGTLQEFETGVNGDFAASNPSDILFDMIRILKPAYRTNANWAMNRRLVADIRKFKDGDGNYLWKPGLEAGQPDSLLGYPIREMEGMPSKSTGSKSIAFGDFQRGYLIVDRFGTRVLRDPYTSKGNVLFYTTRRVGGGVQDFDAIKLMSFST